MIVRLGAAFAPAAHTTYASAARASGEANLPRRWASRVKIAAAVSPASPGSHAVENTIAAGSLARSNVNTPGVARSSSASRPRAASSA